MIEVLGITTLTTKELCSLAFECQAPARFPLVNWNVTFPNVPKPTPRPPQPPSVSDSYGKKKNGVIHVASFQSGSPRLTVLHLSDAHVDFKYKPGSQADCSKPLCCRDGQPRK